MSNLMSIIDPLACEFAKVAVFSILCSKTELQKKIGESEKELQSRELNPTRPGGGA